MIEGERYDLLVAGELNPDAIVLDESIEPEFGQVERLVDRGVLTIGSSGAIVACGARGSACAPPTSASSVTTPPDASCSPSCAAAASTWMAAGSIPERPTGLSVVLSKGGDRAILTSLGAMSSLTAADVSDELLGADGHLHVSSPHLQSGLRDGLAELVRPGPPGRRVDLARSGLGSDGAWGAGSAMRSPQPTSFCRTPPKPAGSPGSRIPTRRSPALAERIETVVVKLGAEGAIARRGYETREATRRAGRGGRQRPAPATASPPASCAGSRRPSARRRAAPRRGLRVAVDARPRRVDAQPQLTEALELADSCLARRLRERRVSAKIAFVGAGSVEFTGMLIADILGYPELRDVDDLPSTTSTPSGSRPRRASPARPPSSSAPRPRSSPHLERRAALDGADYVINMIQVGGHAATVIDHEIPARYGLRQTIGDTLGVGGVFRALRTIPVMQAIAADMAELCPDAWLLNYTNPMAMLCWATYMGTPPARIVGLCHSVQNTTRQLAELVDVPFDEVTFLGAGVNHQAFILRFERDGEDLYPRLDEAIERDPELLRRVRMQMYRRLGYFPTESSEHSAEYLPWLMRDDEAIERYRLWVGRVRRAQRGEPRRVRAHPRAPGRREPLQIEPSDEYAPQIIHSIETGAPRVIYGNVRNTGLIENLPADACVEVPCLVDGSGVRPTWIGELPPQLAALNRTYLNVCELTVRAALEGARNTSDRR